MKITLETYDTRYILRISVIVQSFLRMYINYFWHGRPLEDVEIVCLLSSMAFNEKVRLFSYEKIANVPAGVELADAREVMDQEHLIRFRRTLSPALGSNRFRYLLQSKGLGIWFDLDILQIKRIEYNEDYIFAFQDEKIVNNAVLLLPQSSSLLNELCDFVSEKYPNPPFYDDDLRDDLARQASSGNAVPAEELPWGVFGPHALTYFIKKNNLMSRVKKRETFYPLNYDDAHLAFMNNINEEMLIPEETKVIHLWNEMLRKPSRHRPNNPAGEVLIEKNSYFEIFAREKLGYKIKSI